MSARLGMLAAIVALLAVTGAPPARSQPAPGAAESGQGLTAFRSDAELRRFLRSLRPEASRREGDYAGVPPPPPPPPPPAPPPPAAAPSMAQESVVVTGSRIRQSPTTGLPSITNTQEVGVDEGGIVKNRGDILVILRRGRLFTISTARGTLRPVDSIDAFPPGVNARGDWYDEMLIAGNRVIVIGYSYSRGGTEVSRFRLTDDGRLSFEDAYHLKSNDYYSSRNYASRLIGNQLIMYTPLYLNWTTDPLEALPGVRRWSGEPRGRFRPIATSRQIYVSPALKARPDGQITTLHSLVSCDLAARVMDCRATGVLGPESRTFYVSPTAVYLWLSEAGRRAATAASSIYRLPLSLGRPQAAGVRGAPVDQFSFDEDARDRVLNVLVRSEGRGDAMGAPEFSAGSAALLRLPLAAFGDGSREADRRFYRGLPRPAADQSAFRNRFVGDWLVYAFNAGRESGRVVAVPVRGGPVAEFDLPSTADRIEPLGADALLVGDRAGDLVFSALDLTRARPRLADPWVLPESRETESRSHAFFYRPDDADGANGVLGLPVSRAAPPELRELFPSTAAMLFLRRTDRRFRPLGELEAEAAGAVDDDCVASCVDWYGNARPIFLGDRTFALLGYELVEGAVGRDRIRELRRVNFAPSQSVPEKR